MAIFVPYNSQVGIGVAGGGRAANYVGAGAFRVQSAMPNALNHLSRGIDRLGGSVHALALERRNKQNAVDMLADQIAEKDAFRAFDADYRKTHKGADAREAEADYESYFSERSEGLRRKWGDNPGLMQVAEGMFAPIRQSGLSGAYDYSTREEKDYERQKLAAAEMGMLREAADPAMAYKDKLTSLTDLENSMRMLAGGRNIDPELAAVRQNFALEHLQGLLLNGKTGEAEAYVNGNKSVFGDKTNDALERISARQKSLAAERVAGAADSKALIFAERLEAGEDAQEIMQEILALPKQERGPVKMLFHSYQAALNAAQKEKTQDGIIDNRLKMQDMSPGEVYRFVEMMPETTLAERRIKQQAKLDYSVMASHAGLSGSTDPDAYDGLLDAISHAEVKSSKDLRAHDLAVRVAGKDLQKLVQDLNGASLIQDTDLKTAFCWALGKDESSPNAGALHDAEKADLMKFAAWANTQAKNSNRAKEPGYARELARQWRIEGDTPGKWLSGKRFSDTADDPGWLPDISEEESRRIEALFMRDAEGLEKWRSRFPHYADDPEALKRAYYKWALAKRRGPRARGEE